MAPAFLRRPTCFFCLSTPRPTPADPRAFRCPHCGCWNRYDASGEILSDEPAMHDEKLNTRSFARRASPHRDRLPTTYGKGPFCHTCQTNQMLLLNLLSNYLPPPQASLFPTSTPSAQIIVSQHPDHAQRLEQLPAYRESLHIRYPPVCSNCLPAVEDEIEQKNQMARTKALAGWLKESKGKERHRVTADSPVVRERLGLHLAVWRVRGALWWVTLLCILVAHAAAIRGYDFPPLLARAIPVLPALCLLSLSYVAWDPTYHHFKKARIQGRHVRIKGKTRYMLLQALSWFSRFATSILLALASWSSSWDYLHTAAYPSSHRLGTYCLISLVVELLVFSSSFTILHLQRPPAIRLVETSVRSSVGGTPESSAHSARASPMPTAPLNNEPDLFASLTLSSKPLTSSTNPMFGRPSLASHTPVSNTSPSPIRVDENLDEDAMDWAPTNPSPVRVRKATDDSDGVWLRPQQFFPPEHPTGLESLFANTKLDDGNAPTARPTTLAQRQHWSMMRWWIATVTVVLIPLGSIVYHTWVKGWIH